MEKAKIENFKNRFISMLNQLAFENQDDNSNLASGDEVDRSNGERETLLGLKLQGRKRFLFIKIQEALFRIANGTFGECTECGCDIGEARLNARPMATKCLKCKEDEEREENQIDYAKRSHTLGQTFNNSESNPRLGAGDEIVVTQNKIRKLSKEELGVNSIID